MRKNFKFIVIGIACLSISSQYLFCETVNALEKTNIQGNKVVNKTGDNDRNTPSIRVATSQKKVAKTNKKIKPISQILSDIVIYNTHANEAYKEGKKVTDVANELSKRLVKEGIKSSFVKCIEPKNYAKSYSNSREVITKSVKNYSNSILLDIHRDVSNKKNNDPKRITFILAQSNPHYLENKKFATSLINEINKNKKIQATLFEYKNGILSFNEDLSNKAVVIELGNDKSSNNDIENAMNELVLALKNIEKTKIASK